ncbi:class I SAM-dependent methyltransferase [Flindersiella endophytica]
MPSERQMIEANQANWDARVPVHTASEFYRREAAYWFADYEWDDLGELADRDMLHLQCHLGTETIELARRGARVTGLDISAASVEAARELAADAGLEAGFVQADVHDAIDVLGTQRFDVVYTGKGALCYVPDLDRWASVVHQLLRPGGRVYVVEFHPLLMSLGTAPRPEDNTDEDGGRLSLRADYLAGRGARRRDSDRTYTDGPALQTATVSYEWAHGIGELVTALLGAGFRIDRLRETGEIPWQRWPTMHRTKRGWWRLPDKAPRIPLLYALLATRAE